MVPIYDSDLAEDRWSKAEWTHYELWEKVDQRIRKHNRLWIAAAILVFLLLSSVPVIIEQRPKWKTLGAVRKLGQEINWMKSEAATHHAAYRLRFAGNGSLDYVIETAAHCMVGGGEAVFKPVLEASLISGTTGVPGDAGAYALLSREKGQALNMARLLESYCYDPLLGSQLSSPVSIEGGSAFAIIPVNDLSAGRMDRLSFLLISGPSSELSFE